ncbi:MAG: DMT family transporter [Gammaproteobacteria bacterium]
MAAVTIWTTVFAMLAFAANSLLCRMALGNELIDAASFTSIRIIAGAAMLIAIAGPRWSRTGRAQTNWLTVAMLFIYMAFFSFAYRSLSAGTGALIGFVAVQLTMFGVAINRGERFTPLAWGGLLVAAIGVVYLVSPGLRAPDLLGSICMAVAGIGWGVYSLIGSGKVEPRESTANNFIGAIPLTIVLQLMFLNDVHLTRDGILLAAVSGAITSGLGYVLWYSAIRGLSISLAATVQLSVPVITAFGGVVLLAEEISLRLIIASIATLGGIAVVLRSRQN